MNLNATQKAISALAELKFGWALMADTDPATFLGEVKEEIIRLRALLAAHESVLREIRPQIAEIGFAYITGPLCDKIDAVLAVERAEKEEK